MGRIGDHAYVSSSSPGGGTVGEVCRLRLSIVSTTILSVCFTQFSVATSKTQYISQGSVATCLKCIEMVILQ